MTDGAVPVDGYGSFLQGPAPCRSSCHTMPGLTASRTEGSGPAPRWRLPSTAARAESRLTVLRSMRPRRDTLMPEEVGMKVERTISIARSPADVFRHVADVRNDPSWHTDVLEVKSSTDEVGVGTVFDIKVKPSMGVSGGTMTVTRLEP